jgi:hypothetical protein
MFDLKTIFLTGVLILSADLLAHRSFSARLHRKQERYLNRVSERLDEVQAIFRRELAIIKNSPLSLGDEDDLRILIVRASRRSQSWGEFFFDDVDMREYPWIDFQSRLLQFANKLESSVSSRAFRNNRLLDCSEADDLKQEVEACLSLMYQLADYIAQNYEYIRETRSLSARRANEALLRSIQISLSRPRIVYHPCVVYHHSTVIF